MCLLKKHLKLVSNFHVGRLGALIGSKCGALLILVVVHLPASPFIPLYPATILCHDPLYPYFPWNARHLRGGGDVSRMRMQDWLLPCWRHRGWLCALAPPTLYFSHAGCNRHREMVHDSSKPQFSKAVRTEGSPYVSPSPSHRRSFLPRSHIFSFSVRLTLYNFSPRFHCNLSL